MNMTMPLDFILHNNLEKNPRKKKNEDGGGH